MRKPLHPCVIIRDAKPETALTVYHCGTIATMPHLVAGYVGYMVRPNSRTYFRSTVAIWRS